MTFLNPILAVAALSCIAIPIVIHILMRKRRRPVEWGAMRFLIEAYQRQRKRLNLEQLLLLASRCLLVALLALAVGKPILQAAGAIGPRGPRTLYLLIDNSLTAGATDASGGSALDRFKATALKLVAELEQSRGDRVGVLALGSPADAMVLPATVDLSGAAGVIRDIAPTDAKADFAGALEKLRDLREAPEARRNEGGVYLAMLSDFRVGSEDVDQSLSAFAGAATGSRIIALHPALGPLSNVAIVDVSPLESVVLGGSGERTALPVRVALKRSGEMGAAVSKVRVEVMPQARSATDGLAEALSTAPKAAERVVTWKAGEESAWATLTPELTAGELGRAGAPVVLRASIDRDAIISDGTLMRTIESRDRLAVAVLAPPSAVVENITQFPAAQWLTLALSPADDGSLRTRRTGDIAVTRLDPVHDLDGTGAAGSGTLGPLTGFDAIMVPEPHLIDVGGWQRLRVAADNGAAVVVFPSAGEATHSWLDSFQSAFGLDLDVAREAKVLAAPLRLVPPPGEGASLFAMLSGEFEDLSKSVGVNKILEVHPRGGTMSASLSLSDGSALVLTGLPAQARARGDANAETTRTTAPVGRGVVILVTAAMDLSWTDLPAKPLMVPFVQEMVRQGVGLAASGRTGVAGQTISFPSGTVELSPAPFSSSDADKAAAGSPIPVDSVRGAATPIRRAGLWKARASSGAVLGMVAVRADTSASSVDLRGEAEVASWLSSLGVSVEWLDESRLTTQAAGENDSSHAESSSVLSSGPQKPPISFPLLVAAMFVGLAEVVMARVFSHARVGAGLDSFDGSATSGVMGGAMGGTGTNGGPAA